jgi:flagellar motor component MotA
MGRKVRSCTKCGYAEYEYLPVLVAENAEKGGASAGVIVAITIPSVLALAAGGFSAFWFGYKKKTIKDLAKVLEKALAVFKK